MVPPRACKLCGTESGPFHVTITETLTYICFSCINSTLIKKFNSEVLWQRLLPRAREAELGQLPLPLGLPPNVT